MKINNIQANSRNEVVVVNRKVNVSKPSFQAQKLKPVQTVFDRLEVDMTTRVGYKGERKFTPAPEGFKNGLGMVLRKMGINWDTHVDLSKPRRSYQ